MLAGLTYAQGEAVILLDADLQHPPSLIPKMVEQYEKGYDQVVAKRNRKGESLVRAGMSRVYYKVMNRLTELSSSMVQVIFGY